MGSDDHSIEAASTRPATRPRHAQLPGLAWDWSAARLGAVYALPAAVVVLNDRSRGLALAVGVLPAAIAGLTPTRRGRLRVVVLGVFTGIPMFLASLFACLVSMSWPERAPPDPPGAGTSPTGPTLAYGLRLGAAGATAAAIGFVLGLEHVGWACHLNPSRAPAAASDR